jgi:hypothetical protein
VLLLHITPLKAFAKLFTDVLNGRLCLRYSITPGFLKK